MRKNSYFWIGGLKASTLVGLLALLTSNFLAQDRYDYHEVLNCERALLYKDVLVDEAIERTKENGFLIVLVRPGKDEHSDKLTRRRVLNAHEYFKGRGSRLASEKVIIGAGDRVNGFGRIEYYLDGKLSERLLYPKKGYICHEI